MPQFSGTDTKLIRELHELIRNRSAEAAIEEAFVRAGLDLESRDDGLPYASAELPIDVFKADLSPDVRDAVNMCRVFILRRGCRMMTPEIHRNSIQRLLSYRGSGTIHSAKATDPDVRFVPWALKDNQDGDGDLDVLWDVVPANTWHFPEADASGDWNTVTFHSASSFEIVEEYQDSLE